MTRCRVLLGLLALILLTGCTGTTPRAEISVSRITATVTATVTVSGGASESVPSSSPTSQGTAVRSSAAAQAAGTRAQPIPAGTPANVGAWIITLGPTDTDAADAVAAENQFNDPPAAGRQFVMVQVSGQYNGSESKLPAVDLRIQFVGSAGNTFGFGTDDHCGVIPNSFNEVGEVFTGATATGNECVSVPIDQINGVWSIESGFGSDAVFFGLT